ncbi:MAG: hypothetical protein F7C08_03850 [Desulfurococcales archaeon]|nr:hypothetical protein [Desulfurococcales archaeon]MCE4605647.1 hypothetical protein [Desulfurococcales archaeon]
MRRAPLILLALLALSVAAPLAAQAQVKAVIAVDLSHGQATKGLDTIVNSCQECRWILILQNEEQKANIEPGYLQIFDEVRVGGLTQENLMDAQILLIGQATTVFSDEEVNTVAQWFSMGGKAIWVGGDSDYPAQGSETAQVVINQVAEAIGSIIRSDYISVEDDRENAGAPYRVLGIIDPDPAIADFILNGLQYKRVLFHGPGALYILVDDEPVNPVKSPEMKPENVYIIARTSDQSRAVEHQADPMQGQHPAEFYDPLDDTVNTGPFPLMMAEMMGDNKLFIVSSETPYGGYEPMTAPSYKDKPLDGPVFVANMIKFMVSVVTGAPIQVPPTQTTVTIVQTTTVEKTVTTTLTQTQQVTQTVTQTVTQEMPTTVTSTTTVTQTQADWTISVALFIVGILLGAAAIYATRK